MISKNFDHNLEDNIYQKWQESGAFQPKKGEANETFTIMMPPPNATGTLHMGHASMLAIQDIIIRFKRMQGFETLWLPGTDHAAIATQDKVESMLINQTGKNRHDLGREKFLNKVDEFVKESQATIIKQTQKMGSSCDWSMLKFTLDPDLKEAVSEMFIRLYNDNLLYKGGRIVNWDPNMQTTVADDEVEYKEEVTNFYYFQFGPVVIGTSRPETKFLDDTIVVHPDDERYKHLIGKEFELEWIEGPIKAKVIADESIDMELGTGAMTISPAHSFVDYEIAQKNNLQYQQIIGLDGKILKSASNQCAGLDLKEGRKKVVQILKEKKLVTDVQNNYRHKIAVNYRGGGVIEPQIMDQWFIDVNKEVIPWKNEKLSFKQIMQRVIQDNDINILPKSQENVYFNWINKLNDWCISRQIWYGHSIPAWYKDNQIKVQKNSPGEDWVQDPDSLDTWFSSGMWTFSTLGWPNKTEMLEKFHPTDVLETGYDILFFWVARMILMTTYATGQIPFKTVYLHGLVRDKNGEKMSKSKGNGIDPLDVIEKYGTDAVRLSLFMGTRPGQDVRIYEEKIASFRNFVTKIWNSARYVITNLDTNSISRHNNFSGTELSQIDKWILTLTQEKILEITNLLNTYKLSEAGTKIYDFLWNDFCSWYLEMSKQQQNPQVLFYVLSTILKLLHPFVPFVTEELWKNLKFETLLINEPWPKYDLNLIFKSETESINQLNSSIKAIRSLMADFEINKNSHVSIHTSETELYTSNNQIIKHLAKIETLEITSEQPTEKVISQVVNPNTTVFLHLDQNIDIQAEIQKMQQESDNLNKYILGLESKLANANYVNNAPEHIVQETKDNLAESQAKLDKITQRLNILQ